MRKQWSKVETDFLVSNYPVMSESELCAALGKEWHSVKLKAFKLGIKRRVVIDERVMNTVFEEYQNGVSIFDLVPKYNISTTSFYRFLKTKGLQPNRKFVKIDSESLKKDYLELGKTDLEKKYGNSYTNIKQKARALGLKRPKSFQYYTKTRMLSEGQICALYLQGLNLDEVAREAGITSGGWIGAILERNGVARRQADVTRRCYAVNQGYFSEVNTPTKAYFLGFIAADGCVGSEDNGVSLCIQEEDKYVLEDFRKDLESDLPITTVVHEPVRKNMSGIRIFSEKMVNDLARYSIIPRKTLVLKFPELLPEEFLASFVRGFLDGDGMIYANFKKKYPRVGVNFTSTLDFLTALDRRLVRATGVKPGCIHHVSEKNTYRLFYCKPQDVIALGRFMYSQPGPFLTRKKTKFLSLCNKLEELKVTELFIAKEEWLKLTPHELAMYKFKIFGHYRRYGFPYHKEDLSSTLRDISAMSGRDYSHLIDSTKVLIDKAGISALWPFFPHVWEMRKNTISPMELFKSDSHLKKLIDNRIRYADNMSDAAMRRGLQLMYGGTAYNFRPSAAAAIYQRYCAPESTVWDMSFGFCGRLLGAFASGKVQKYIGTDPCVKTYDAAGKIKDILLGLGKDLKDVSLHCLGSEEFIPEKESLDLCFTSPPYFDTEKYSEEASQSYIKFPTQETWLTGFMRKTLENCLHGLKPEGKLVVNIANVSSYPTLETDFLATADKVGFNLQETLKYMMNRKPTADKVLDPFKYEPIFVFSKA